MKLAKPQWNLLIYILPPMFSSIMLVIFFPDQLFKCLIGMAIFSVVAAAWAAIKHLPSTLAEPLPKNSQAMGLYRWLFLLLGIVFLLGISAIFFSFLTASTPFSQGTLDFAEITASWKILFLVGIGILCAQIVIATVLANPASKLKNSSAPIKRTLTDGRRLFQPNADAIENTQISNRIFLQLSGFLTLLISSALVILTVANGLARWIGFELPTGVQLQTMVASTLLYLPFMRKKQRKQQSLTSKYSRRYRFLRLVIGLVVAIILLSILTLPLTGMPISIQFLSYGITVFQWKLLVLAWWIGITPLVADQIASVSAKKSLIQQLIALMVCASVVYDLGSGFLSHGGEAYFLAVVHQGILALLLTALPIAGLVFLLLPFYDSGVRAVNGVPHKYIREQHRLTRSLIQAAAITTGIYWVTGLPLLLALMLMIAIPRLVLFLAVEVKAVVAEKKRPRLAPQT